MSDAVQRRLRILSGDYKLVKLPKQKYEELESAIRKMNIPFPQRNRLYPQTNQTEKGYLK